MTEYLISDMHFDHHNIIEYCGRPFANVNEMNLRMVENWNKVVKQDDIVYFLGDFSYGRKAHNPSYWLRQLHGSIVFIMGSHDYEMGLHGRQHLELQRGGIDFYLCHNPADVPADWKGWSITGHVHNRHPFYQPAYRRFNVSADAVGFTPVPFTDLLAKIAAPVAGQSLLILK